MGLEDLAMLRAVHGSTVLCPCDANQTAQLVEQMADLRGIRYLRIMRPSTPVIYGPDDRFEIGDSHVVRAPEGDQVTLVGAGITVHEAIEAAETLEGEGVAAWVVDSYSVKPIGAEALRAAARATGRIVVAADHWPEGGLGECGAGSLHRQRGVPPSPQAPRLARCRPRARPRNCSRAPGSTRPA
jgi:transketolase